MRLRVATLIRELEGDGPDLPSAYLGEAYCVKCKRPTEFAGHVEETNGRRFAKGICPTCGTKVTSIQGRA